jgi:hypothetical protein
MGGETGLTRTVPLRIRLLLAAFLSAVTAATTLAAIEAPAMAMPDPSGLAADNTLYPSGCRQVTTDNWGPSCYVGYNYVKISVSVMAVQYVLQATGHNPGPIDCDFGSRTDTATISYQRYYGLEQDGVVGRYTWANMQLRTTSAGVSDAYGSYYNVGIDGLRFYWQFVLAGAWFVRDPYYSNRYVAVAGYTSRNVTPFCP